MCDSFVALSGHTADGSVIFGKNSDREPNEPQLLERHPAREHPAGTTLRATHLEIPQAARTHAVLLSRPWRTWGAEMGANEHGVVAGNEAVFTRVRHTREPGLIGMDLLRLALERAGTARDALHVVTDLLERFGQEGRHGGRLVYHNSFLIADPREAWVLETAGRLWAARRAEGFCAISNGLTIGEEMDEAHPRLADEARRLGRLPRGGRLHFARCFSDRLVTALSGSAARRRRALERLDGRRGTLGVADAFALLRDHGDAGDGYRPDRHALMRHLCAHAANGLTRDASQTTASLVVRLDGAEPTCWATGTAAPCTSVFKPVWLEAGGLPAPGPSPGDAYDEQCGWWRHERLHRLALRDLPTALRALSPGREALERRLLADAGRASPGERSRLTARAFELAEELDGAALDRLGRELRRAPALPPYRAYWRRQNRQAGLPPVP
jgi:dipeptidase